MIAVDWGTSSFRAWRLADDGSVRELRSAAAGLLACGGRFEAVLAQQLDGWDDALIAMAGMIGSRSGWREVPYVAAPAGAAEIAAGMRAVEAASLPGRRVLIAPGLSHRPAEGAPEVMRGEETQLVGLLERLPPGGRHLVCLPGTHSKWVQLDGERITGWRTAMTGELYALLRRHSLLAASMPAAAEDDADDPEAFARGVHASATTGGLTHHLFGVRTHHLMGELGIHEAPSYLSGLLIGHELRALLPAGAPRVHLVGSRALLARYERALGALGVASQCHAEDLGAHGLHALLRVRGA